MREFKISLVAFLSLVLLACVTINIYFPAAQAERAAERIVDDILGKQPPAGDKGSLLERPLFQLYAARTLELLIPSAQAAQPDFNVDTPQIRQLQAGMKARIDQLRNHFASGAIGFTRDARIDVRDNGAIPLNQRARVSGLVKEENRDRDALYSAIARANGHPEWEPQVRATFAKTWIERAESGWWYQNSAGSWAQR
ncbi:MAG: YdbL family protein [Gammaproteobacteria bacterium]|nr:YdbL family protein [Gammaproteobacteria bacterium]